MCATNTRCVQASPAIAVAVVGMLAEAGCAAALTRDPSFNPRRAPLIAPKKGLAGLKFSKKETDYWKETDPSKNVICKCERVTEAEVNP
jgi:glycerol-3-phosphate dehydrogenase|tara:strand:- start:54 stop:320 length:267 start_codon:yes stop_codon:yes gene_type:complete